MSPRTDDPPDCLKAQPKAVQMWNEVATAMEDGRFGKYDMRNEQDCHVIVGKFSLSIAFSLSPSCLLTKIAAIVKAFNDDREKVTVEDVLKMDSRRDSTTALQRYPPPQWMSSGPKPVKLWNDVMRAMVNGGFGKYDAENARHRLFLEGKGS